MADKERDFIEEIFGVKANTGERMMKGDEEGIMFNPGMTNSVEAILWGRTLQALDDADVGPSPSDEEIVECVEACIVAMKTDKTLHRRADDDMATTDWPSTKAKVAKAVSAYRDELLRLRPPGGQA
jgi:hypothetical protein